MAPIQYRTTKELQELVKRDSKANATLLQSLKKKKGPPVDNLFHSLHEEAFCQFNCLECANCCRSISPIVTEKDIDRLSKHFRIKPVQFIEQYLHIDEDHDYIFNETPCPFLLSDNYCMVYESRPKACREYPHTDRRKMQQILKLTLKNCEICPVVYEIWEEIKRQNR
ncbi:MAG TPA: YkgJ family cysteine cluster protein [Prolixibacteraceae bacterium]|nr:YkgJ family cysteine cluster protein [Prolixibacteraceae bacterium]HPS13563.1 YkgJ family cysteine cluster protein [Prolixibacteraceae bacterium]